MISPAQATCAALDDARLLTALTALDDLALAALWFDWSFWSRPEQVIEPGVWRSHGLLTGRRFGKTRADCEFILREVRAGRAMRVGLMAQTEDKTVEVLVEGDAGLIERSPPWFKPIWERGRLLWPNGAQAFVFTPERPQGIRGPGVHLMWLSEIQSWPLAQAQEALSNASLMTSLGYGKTLWEATPKRRHPLIRMLLQDAKLDPVHHVVVTGRTDDNAANNVEGFADAMRARYAGTQREREELDGVFCDDDAGALWRQEWIDRARRDTPARFKRRVIAIDPAITARRGSDQTGLCDVGLAPDGQLHPCSDRTGRYTPEEWADCALAMYVEGQCDCVIAETNRGGELVVSMLRARAQSPERVAAGSTLRVVLVEAAAPTRHVPGVVYVKVVHARGRKEERASPVAALTEQGRVSFPRDASLEELEECLCTWEPDPRYDSPDRMDAFVWACAELVPLLGATPPNAAADVRAAIAASRRIKAPGAQRVDAGFGYDAAYRFGQGRRL